MATNNLTFLQQTLANLNKAHIEVWLFGGWAEELLGLCEPRSHHDIDLLYPAENFDELDAIIAANNSVKEVLAKRFSHKRAVEHNGILIEFILVQKNERGLFTRFFDGRTTFQWPEDTFQDHIQARNDAVKIASKEALEKYKSEHQLIEQAYSAYSRSVANHE